MSIEIPDIILKVINNEASPEEKIELKQWLSLDPENLKVFRQSENLWHAMAILSSNEQFSAEQAFKQFHKSVNEGDKKKIRLSSGTSIFDMLIRIAAIIIIIFGLTFLLFRKSTGDDVPIKSMCSIIAPRGSKSEVILPDSSKVWLNAGSKLSYANNFNESCRNVYLEGEGYFEVKKNRSKPFNVNAGGYIVRALGTSFDVKAYPSENTIEATLLEGKVQIEKILSKNEKKKLMSLEPDQRAIIYKNCDEVVSGQKVRGKKQLKISGNDCIYLQDIKGVAELATAWTKNYLYFDDERFRDLAIKIERCYDVSIEFANDEIGNYRFSGKFDDVIIDEVFAALRFAVPFEYVIKDKKILIYRNSVTGEKNQP